MSRLQVADEHFHKALGLLDHNFVYYYVDEEGRIVVDEESITDVEEILTAEDIDYEIIY